MNIHKFVLIWLWLNESWRYMVLIRSFRDVLHLWYLDVRAIVYLASSLLIVIGLKFSSVTSWSTGISDPVFIEYMKSESPRDGGCRFIRLRSGRVFIYQGEWL